MRKYFTIAFILFFTLSLFAQPRGDRKTQLEERIQSMRIAFLTEKLALSPDESQRFWPVYNEFTKALGELKKSEIVTEPSLEMNEEDAEAFLNQRNKIIAQEIALKQKYVEKLRTVIPIQKIAMLQFVEKDFRKEMLSQVRRKSDKRKRKN